MRSVRWRFLEGCFECKLKLFNLDENFGFAFFVPRSNANKFVYFSCLNRIK